MADKKASSRGRFQPLVNEGDCVRNRQPIGTILFGSTIRQLANATGEVTMILNSRIVNAGEVICTIDENADCAGMGNITPLIGRARKPKKKAAAKKAKNKRAKAEAAPAKKVNSKKAINKKASAKRTANKKAAPPKKAAAKKRGK